MCLKVKSVGKPDAVAPHVRFDERGWETGLHATAPVLDSTIYHIFAKIFNRLLAEEINPIKITPKEAEAAKARLDEVRKKRRKRHARKKAATN